MNQSSRIPEWKKEDFDGVLIWFSEMSAQGLLFHPDDDPSEIVSISDGHSRLFTDMEAAELRTIISKMFASKGDEVYEAGLPIFRAAVGQYDA